MANKIRGSKRRIKTGPKKGRFAKKPGTSSAKNK